MTLKRLTMLSLACFVVACSLNAMAGHRVKFVVPVFHPDITENCTKAHFCDDEYYDDDDDGYYYDCGGTFADVKFTFNTKDETLRGHTDGHAEVYNACGEFVRFKDCPGSDFGLPGYGWETKYHVHSNGDAHLNLKLEDAELGG